MIENTEKAHLISEFEKLITRDHSTVPLFWDRQDHIPESMAAFRIEARSIAYANMEVAAKKEKLAHCAFGDISARLNVLRETETDLISPETAQKWVEADLRDLRLAPDRTKDYAAIEIMENIRRNPLYASALCNVEPEMVRQIAAADAENDRRVAAKEDWKNMECEAPDGQPGAEPMF